MSDKKRSSGLSKDELVIKAMKITLIDIIKDTTVQPGMRHPLSDGTIDSIRKCLVLISDREQELAKAAGRPMTDRPRYVDEPRSSVVVSITGLTGKKDKDDPRKD